MKISVITVAYNSSKTIGDTVRSVRQQAHGDFEHLVIDGRSTDGTVEVAQMQADHRLKWWSESDRGIYDAMNKGLQRATGDVIGFLNADDFFADHGALARVAEAFRDSRVEACHADLVYVSQDTRSVVRYWKSRPYHAGSFAKGWTPAHPTFYVRRSALERLGPFNLAYRLAADAEFMMRYLEGGVCSTYIPHVQVRMRVGGATNQSWRNIMRQNQEIFEALRHNGIPHSKMTFWVHKLANRLAQRLSARWIGP